MRLLLAILLAGTLLVLAPGPAVACSCTSADLAIRVESADSIGSGTVAWVAINAETMTFAVDVTEVHKGRLGSREKVRTPSDVDTCGLRVEEGRRYLLFVQGSHGGTLRTDLCAGSTPFSRRAAQRVRALAGGGELVMIDQSDITERRDWFPPWVQWALVGTAALVLAGAATVAMRRG